MLNFEIKSRVINVKEVLKQGSINRIIVFFLNQITIVKLRKFESKAER